MPKKKKVKAKEEKLKKEQKERKEEETFHVDIDLSEDSSEQSLERLAETPEISETADFSEFMIPETSDMPTLTLPSSSSPSLAEPTENLEESASSSIASSPTTTQPVQQDYVSIYNQPDYTAGTSEEKIIEGLRRSDRAVRTAEQLRDIRPRVEIEEWHETGEARERTSSGENLKDYMVTEVERREEERKLPFEQKRKYRELKR